MYSKLVELILILLKIHRIAGDCGLPAIPINAKINDFK